MTVTVGTFNLNNLFSRFNFQAELNSLTDLENGITFEGHMQEDDGEPIKVRTYKGKLVKQKDPEEAAIIAERIKRINLDVLAVQEVEDQNTLKEFNKQLLGDMYPFVGVIEGNDPRLIDVGILSKLPIGGLTSWQYTIHPDDPGRRIFSRDVLEVEIFDPSRKKLLFTLYNNHLKSQFVDFRTDPEEGKKASDLTRKRQSEMLTAIMKRKTRPGGNYVVLGDMNDSVEAQSLSPLTTDQELALVNAITDPEETNPFKEDLPSKAWTHRFKESGKPAHYALFDQIWLSPSLSAKQTKSMIDRRTLVSGDGSDHDPAWVVLDL